MSRTVANLKDSVSGILSGIKLDRVTNLYGALERAARVMAQKADIPEASGIESITLYDGVFDYLAPTTIFGGALTDFRPQGDSRSPLDYVYKKGIEFFDRTKHLLPNGYMLSFEYRKGTPIVRVAQTRTIQKVILDSMNDDDGWTASGDASGLAVDETVYYQQPASLRFNLVASGSQGILTKTLDNAIDLTDYEGVGVVFLAFETPSASAITSIALQLGNDSGNYFNISDTEGFLGAFQADEWLLVALDLSLATEVGSVDITAVDYVKFLFNYDGTACPNVRVGGLWISLPSLHQIYFQSAAIFSASGQNPSQSITTDDDVIILNDAAYTIYEHEAATAVLIQSGGKLASPAYQILNRILHGGITVKGGGSDPGLYAQYRADNPSQEIKETGSYYLE